MSFNHHDIQIGIRIGIATTAGTEKYNPSWLRRVNDSPYNIIQDVFIEH